MTRSDDGDISADSTRTMDWLGGGGAGDGYGFPGFGGARVVGGQYKESLSCMSVAMMPGRERTDADKGGKVFLPQSVLRTLTRLNIQYPMLFSLASSKSGRKTHCGVLEFVSEPGVVNAPRWMMMNLAIEEGDQVCTPVHFVADLPAAACRMPHTAHRTPFCSFRSRSAPLLRGHTVASTCD